MGLTKEQQELVMNHLDQKMGKVCPMCSNRNWKIEPDLQFLGALDPEYRQPIAGKIFPIVTAMCNNCYFLAQFSAMKIGVLK